MKKIANLIKETKLGNKKYVAVQMRARKPSVSGDIPNNDKVAYRRCFQEIADMTKKYMSDHNITKAFLAADFLQRNTSGWSDHFNEEILEETFQKTILGSDIPWSMNTDSDPEFAHLWKHDRGAHGMVDQLLAIDAEYFVYTGASTFSKRISDVRKNLGRQAAEVSCKASGIEEDTDHSGQKDTPNNEEGDTNIAEEQDPDRINRDGTEIGNSEKDPEDYSNERTYYPSEKVILAVPVQPPIVVMAPLVTPWNVLVVVGASVVTVLVTVPRNIRNVVLVSILMLGLVLCIELTM